MTIKDFLPTASLEVLKQRARMLARLRAFFDARGFMEIETPLLSHDTVVDRHLEPIPVCLSTGKIAWLQTSPEFGMKRLLAAGAQAIYQICKSFRADEMGRYHNLEFTMLEWYRTGDNLQTGIDLLAELIENVLETPPTIRLSYRELFENRLGLNPHTATASELKLACQSQGLETASFGAQNLDRDFWLNLILSQILEPTLNQEYPVILYHWPISQSALAVIKETPDPVAERFELYFGGLELANGYHELLDADELLRRSQTANLQREEDGLKKLPEESRLLDAMRNGLPACAGVALGVDRLVMVATGSHSIREVIAFPFDRA